MEQAIYQKLLALHDRLFDLREYDTIVDFIVNDSYKIIPYQIAIVFEYNPKDLKKDSKSTIDIQISEVSGTISQEVNKDFIGWLKISIAKLLKQVGNQKTETPIPNKVNVEVIHKENIERDLLATWADGLGQELIYTNLYSDDNQNIDLLIINHEKYEDTDIINYNFLVKSYTQALTINIKNKKKQRKKFLKASNIFKASILGFIAAMFYPVTPSVMAPAEIISEKTWSINAPISGLIKKVIVEPNSLVKKGEILFSFDQIDLDNNLRLKQQELKILETDHTQAKALGFDDREERAKIFRIKQDIDAKKQEVLYARQQLNLSIVKAPETGTILFKSKNDFLNKPAKIGETVMRLADSNSRVIESWLDINDSIPLEKDIEVFYYSNREPFKPVKARLKYYSYEAYITPQNKIAYRLLADFVETSGNLNNNDNLIIGDHGQIKIYGKEQVYLGKFLFQKPIANLRQWFYKMV